MRIAVLLAAGLAVAAAVAHAQSEDDDEDEMDYYPLVPSGNSLRYGFHYVGGPKVRFGNLGSVPVNQLIVDPTSTAARSYNDGIVNPDGRRDSSNRPINDGLTNDWSVNYASQITPTGDVAYRLYSATSLGVGAKGKSASAAGWELQVGRSLGKLAHKVDVSLVAGISFSSINAKSSGTIDAQLVTLTDTFPLYGQAAPTPPYSAPTQAAVNLVDANGNPLLDPTGVPRTRSVDTSILLGRTPTRSTTYGNATVNGRWQIKGAYYLFRAGPLFQLPLSERFKFTLGAGLALAYVGTDYAADEQIDLEEVTASVQTSEIGHRNVLLPAFYLDANAEYWMTERAGVYVGATYQRSKSFDQTVGGRSAQIDLGTTSGLSTGITLRF